MNQIEISLAIDASNRAYQLLIWLGDLVNRESVSPNDTRQILSSAEAAQHFLRDHAASIPAGLRPDETVLAPTAGILGSYLTVSFDLSSDPGFRARPDPICGAGCPWCWHVDRLAHLTTKKLSTRDRHRASAMMRSAVDQRAGSGRSHSSDSAREHVLLKQPRDVATIAYADDLIARAAGGTSGPWALALWRKFAWTGGSPRKGFQFTLDVVNAAEAQVLRALESSVP